jgi:mRNA-degrading endonuclease YafQ of YafQ-DinJ toxin-antitoxin module
MPEIETTERFEKDFLRLTPELQKKVLKALRLLAENPRHPSLQTKPIQGARGIYEARIDQSHRFTFQRLPNDTLLLRTAGKHDETLKHP